MSIEERRSIRKYTNQPVEKAVIEEVIRAATLAPSAKNRQPWKYLVYAGAEKEKLVDQMEIGLYREREVSPILRNRLLACRTPTIHCVLCGKRR